MKDRFFALAKISYINRMDSTFQEHWQILRTTREGNPHDFDQDAKDRVELHLDSFWERTGEPLLRWKYHWAANEYDEAIRFLKGCCERLTPPVEG